MAIPTEEVERFQAFLLGVAKDLGAMQYAPDTMLWHYTNGSALISILDSMAIYSTQISCLNDSTELRYGSTLFQEALKDLQASTSNDSIAKRLLEGAISYFKEDPDQPAQAASFHFVTCFSEEKDDLSQWRAYGGGENGYAIGFRAADLFGIPNSMLVRVSYDANLHRAVARKAAAEMVRFCKEGIERHAPRDLVQFGQEFLQAWEQQIVMIAPLVKDPGFLKEKEFRIAKGYSATDLASLRFTAKNSMMSRHLPLQPPGRVPSEPFRLPVAEIMIGPSRHQPISRMSVGTLLRQKGYPAGIVSVSKIPFQAT